MRWRWLSGSALPPGGPLASCGSEVSLFSATTDVGVAVAASTDVATIGIATGASLTCPSVAALPVLVLDRAAPSSNSPCKKRQRPPCLHTPRRQCLHTCCRRISTVLLAPSSIICVAGLLILRNARRASDDLADFRNLQQEIQRSNLSQ
eukprot:CAMPEP_0176090190 /NCGR_PEP_ID=MMETSP0120_2-20121206/45169_1 /TAXON_ID=160619 /ORGANISM="Kryptoperidinium foliaceum, Strain CCMP 1326" /LENGTH=148 /DNA_ID=CAMNT_0017424071 /DNA_START=293 /DNA_END=736 /DNA_ORIENTATION=-